MAAAPYLYLAFRFMAITDDYHLTIQRHNPEYHDLKPINRCSYASEMLCGGKSLTNLQSLYE
jgi:hypothetical protein